MTKIKKAQKGVPGETAEAQQKNLAAAKNQKIQDAAKTLADAQEEHKRAFLAEIMAVCEKYGLDLSAQAQLVIVPKQQKP